MLKLTREMLPRSENRWTPIYLEYGRLEVDDSSIKWIGADGQITRLPYACISSILLGPGTTLTHEAIKAATESRCPIVWTGAEGTIFYASGQETERIQANAQAQAALWANRTARLKIAKHMFKERFNEKTSSKSIEELRGAEGVRTRLIEHYPQPTPVSTRKISKARNQKTSRRNKNTRTDTRHHSKLSNRWKMIVIITDTTPPKIRGALKRWFLEPKPNVFVGTISTKVKEKVIEHLYKLDSRWNALIISKSSSSQKFQIEHIGTPQKKTIEITGIQLIEEKPGIDINNLPF